MSKKKVGIIVAVVVIVAMAAGGSVWYFLRGTSSTGNSADKVFVESVASINSVNSGSQNRYSGVVEAQETWEVNKESEQEIKEVFVKVGDMVEEGAALFEYNMEEAKTEIQQAELELEGMRNDITDAQTQINQLSRERETVPQEDRFEYTAEIQEKENSIKQTEYNIESKKVEIQKKQESIDNAVVKSKIAGVVKSINESGIDSMTGENAAYMTILAVGDFRVKGTVSETNIQMLSEEQPVILRSRINEEQTWTGTITKIDTQNAVKNDNDMYYSDSGSSEKATKYPFYVKLDSTDGLMMGQHLFIEMDLGQTEAKEGIWLFEGYIVREEDKTYIWAANSRNKLEKREVELGEYDENLGEYEIVSGLTEEDAIASPMEGLYEGVTTVTDASEIDYSSPLYNQEGENGELPEGEDGELPEGEGGELPEGGELLEGGELPEGEGGELLEGGELPEGEGGKLPEGGELPEGEGAEGNSIDNNTDSLDKGEDALPENRNMEENNSGEDNTEDSLGEQDAVG